MKSKSMKWIVISWLCIAIASCVSCTILNKAYWDHKVDELCAKDGGVIIYEKVVISKKDYPDIKITSTGSIILPHEKDVTISDPFYYTSKTEYLENGNLEVRRYKQSIVRNSDKRTLSTFISYGRSGGDSVLSSWMHPSAYSCDSRKNDIKEFSSTVTIMER